MKPPPTGKTILKLKLRAGRKTFNTFMLVKILLVPLGIIFVIGSLQVAVCLNAHPKKTWTQCLRPSYPQEKK